MRGKKKIINILWGAAVVMVSLSMVGYLIIPLFY